MILKQLHDDLDVIMIVLDGDDAQNVSSVFCIRIFAILVSKHQARVGLFDLPIKQRHALTVLGEFRTSL